MEWLFEKIEAETPLAHPIIREMTEEDFLKPHHEQYLYLRIDRTAGKEEIGKWFRLTVGEATGKTRYRRTTYDKWEIWDLHHLTRPVFEDGILVREEKPLSLLEIARQKTAKEYTRKTSPTADYDATPAYNPELWPPYKRVQAAHNQAVSIIETVEKTILTRKKPKGEVICKIKG